MYSYNKIVTPDGLWVLNNGPFIDERGYFDVPFNSEEFYKYTGIDFKVVQINESWSHHDVVRGLHFQKGEYAQSKIIRCLQGEIMDVVMDIREDSPTFGKIFTINLTEINQISLYVPKGFAHGFIAISNAKIEYLVDAPYNKESESGYKFPFEELNMNKDLVKGLIMSEKDKNWSEFNINKD